MAQAAVHGRIMHFSKSKTGELDPSGDSMRVSESYAVSGQWGAAHDWTRQAARSREKAQGRSLLGSLAAFVGPHYCLARDLSRSLQPSLSL